MREISFFQQYSQRENHLTNNTLLIVRHFYLRYPQKLKEILFGLLDIEEDVNIDININVGPVFWQQIRGSHSVPDALISQKSLEIYFEVKRVGGLRESQIENHIKSIKNENDLSGTKILFALTKNPIDSEMNDRLSESADDNEVIFKAITFDDVIRVLEKHCQPHEVDLKYILDDYKRYLRSKDLLRTEYLTLVPVKNTIEANIEFRLYYEPARRKSSALSKFLGLYKDKCVRHIGYIEAVVKGRADAEGKYKVEKEDIEFCKNGDELTADQLRQLNDSIDKCGDPDIKRDHRFYLLSEFKETEFSKKSKGGMRGRRTFDLSNWLKDKKEHDLTEVVDGLRGEQFE